MDKKEVNSVYSKVDDDILLNWDIPIVYKLPKTNDILKTGLDIEVSHNIAYPKFSFGFQHFLHQSMGADKMDAIKQFENKKKVYLVMNSYETEVDNYDKDISSSVKKYFGKNNVVSNRYYELWELLFMFNLVELNRDLVSTHLGTEDGGFIQALINFRDEYGNKTKVKNDKYFSIDSNVNIKNKNIVNSKSFLKSKSNLVTIQIDKKWRYVNTQEQEIMKELLEGIIKLLKAQINGGNSVIQVYETYTTPMFQIVSLLRNIYNEVYMVKPLTCKTYTSNKYIVCMGFTGLNKENIISNLENVLSKLSNKNNIINIYSGYEGTSDFLGQFIKSNTDMSNRQFALFNQMIKFIEKQNYHGDQYKQKNKEQQIANDKWTKIFLPNKGNIDKSLKGVRSWVSKIIDTNDKRAKELVSTMDV